MPNPKLLVLLIVAAGMLIACGSPAPAAGNTPVAPEITAEPSPEVTAEPSNDLLPIVYDQSTPSQPGWRLRHPDGWQVIVADPNNIFLYSTPSAGENLFGQGLQAGEVVFQITLDIPTPPVGTAADHHSRLVRAIPDTTMDAPAATVINALEGVASEGTSERYGFTVYASTRPYFSSTFIDLLTYVRTDEVDRYQPLIEAIVNSIEYVLATE